jgi:hypothetical protein
LPFRSPVFSSPSFLPLDYKGSSAISQAAPSRDAPFSSFFFKFSPPSQRRATQSAFRLRKTSLFFAQRPTCRRFNPQFQDKKFRQNRKFQQNGLGAAREIEYTVY